MKCPFCGKEMQQGKLRTRGDNYFVPNGCKASMLYTKKKHGKRRRNSGLPRLHWRDLRRKLADDLFMHWMPKDHRRLLGW